jgi:hypothetical protein
MLLFLQGEHIGTTEATETFFAMTKLFQSKDVSTKQLMSLCMCDILCLIMLLVQNKIYQNLGSSICPTTWKFEHIQREDEAFL